MSIDLSAAGMLAVVRQPSESVTVNSVGLSGNYGFRNGSSVRFACIAIRQSAKRESFNLRE